MSENETEALFQLIVVGSSAGGIEALSQLVASLPVPFAVPIVIAQHLDPNRPSYLAQILSRHSRLPVVVVEQQEKLQPGTVYVVPANNHVAISDHDARILSDGQGRPKPSVDLLLSSAAQVYGEKLIAVILTGTGSDGMLGVRAVHENGGTVLAQNPATAAYPGMAQALDPEAVDIIADLTQIGPLLGDLINGKTVLLQPATTQELEPFLNQLRAYTGIDFRTYKPGTILRRLQRRLLATGQNNLKDYEEYLQAHPEEYEQLVSSFLIKVTEFMRDPELFSYLEQEILPQLVEYSQQHNNNELRFWSAGCATGQEAYSLAILLCEVLGNKLNDFNIKVFATDVDPGAIAFARRGFYPLDNLDKLPKELIERYFTLERDGYSVKKHVRELLIFGEHDLSQRAPFPRIDMVLCRNVLIYFNRELQQHALELFAFALRDDGYLVLGRSETSTTLSDLFVTEEAGQRVYRRQGQRRLNRPFALKNTKPVVPAVQVRRLERTSEVRNLFQLQREAQQGRAAKDNLLLQLPVGVVVVNNRFDIQEINSAARRLLSIHTVAIGEDLVHQAQYLPPRELGVAITKAIRENSVTTLERVEVPHLTSGEPTYLQVSCYPHPVTSSAPENSGNPTGYALILVIDITNNVRAEREREQASSQATRQAAELAQSVTALQNANTSLAERNIELEESNANLAQAKVQAEAMVQRHARQMEALVEANRSLLAANEELTTLNADLRTTNEEYLMHAEEAQAAIEESDTLNEEMQATNEELETLNEELQATIEELNTSNADLVVQTDELRRRTEELRVQEQQSAEERAKLAAILSGVGDAVVVVDLAGNILLTNAAYEQTFGGEHGVELLDEAGINPVADSDTPQALAVKGEPFKLTFSVKLADDNQQWWEALGQPVYRAGKAWLGVVVLTDITERSLRRLQNEFLSLVSHELRTPLTLIKGHVELVVKKLEKAAGDNDSFLYGLRLALFQVGQLERLLADLSELNRLQSGKFNLQLEKVRLDELVGQVVETAQALTTRPTIELDKAVSEPLLVRGDTVRLQQLLFNLLNNAIIHAAESPKIIVSLRRLDTNQAELRVQDFGSGIKAEHLANLFSRYYRVLQDKGSSSAGLGLGLFISQEIVMAHGGTIRVESTVGTGTTFVIQLPLLA